MPLADAARSDGGRGSRRGVTLPGFGGRGDSGGAAPPDFVAGGRWSRSAESPPCQLVLAARAGGVGGFALQGYRRARVLGRAAAGHRRRGWRRRRCGLRRRAEPGPAARCAGGSGVAGNCVKSGGFVPGAPSPNLCFCASPTDL